MNLISRRLANVCVIALLVFIFYQLFSPWRIVIEIRSASDSSNRSSTTDGNKGTKESINTEILEQSVKKDYIEKEFGKLEEGFAKSIDAPSDNPIRSRDDSIKKIYEIKNPSDWLDLIDNHDDHVGFLLFLPIRTSTEVFRVSWL